MHDNNTIIGGIGLRRDKVSYPMVRQRYSIGNSGIDLIINRYKEAGLSWEDILKLEPIQVEELIYPPKTSGRETFNAMILMEEPACIGRALTILSWDNPVTTFFRK